MMYTAVSLALMASSALAHFTLDYPVRRFLVCIECGADGRPLEALTTTMSRNSAAASTLSRTLDSHFPLVKDRVSSFLCQ